MKRRDLLLLLGGSALSLPMAARAASPVPVIGFLSAQSPEEWAPFVAAFRNGLTDLGYVEGRNVAIEFRWEFGQTNRSVALLHDLLDRHVAIIVTSGGNQPTLTAKHVTGSIPIVATFGDDPVKLGMVETLDRPGGNLTGVKLNADDLEKKQFALLHELMPKATSIALLADSTPGVVDFRLYRDAALAIGQKFRLVRAASEDDLEPAFARAKQQGVEAMLVASAAFFLGQRARLTLLAARYRIPTLYPARPYVDAGGLISYGADRRETYHQLGLLTASILKGEAVPAESPVRRPTKFDLAINLATAKSLDLDVPASLLRVADMIIR
jgi:putative ABC transport system substrate-binding protein